MSKIKLILISLLAVTSLFGCGDIMDTLDEYTGDGEIRYIGQADSLLVLPGWERLIVTWKNSPDPTIAKVKVKWSDDDMSDSVLLDKGTTYYSIAGLQDASYSVTVSEVSSSGKESLANTLYARPYTDNHEVIQAFSRVIQSCFIFNDRLLLKFYDWQDGIERAVLKFTDTNGQADSLEITQSLVERRDDPIYRRFNSCPYYLLPQSIDMSKPIELHRTGRVDGCEDRILFPVIIMDGSRTFSSDFMESLKAKYGTNSEVLDDDGEIRDSWAANVTELELDCSLDNFDDLLFLPKLKKLVLGKHRYLTDQGISDTSVGQYKVSDRNAALYAVDVLHKLNGLTIERYNKHYSNISRLAYLKEMGKPKLPDMSMYDMSSATVSISPADQADYDSHPSYLIDGDAETYWTPMQQTSPVNYVITVDLGKEVDANGITFVQKNFDKSANDKSLAPTLINVYTADYTGGFEQATYVKETTVGASAGETNVIPFTSTKKVKYVRLIFNSSPYHGLFGSTFAELGLYK